MVGTAYWPAGQTVDGGAIDAFRAEAAAAFPWAGLERGRLALVHRGAVPGDGGAEGLGTRALVVDHAREHQMAGLLTVQGVKYTTARAVAERTVDQVFGTLGRPPAPSRSATAPLAWARPLQGTLGEQAQVAVAEEMARTLADVVLRRLDLGTAGPPPAAGLDEVEAVVARELAWDTARRQAERQALARFYEAAYNGG
jgi:glycerol-3-phosphate dehydrogenase